MVLDLLSMSLLSISAFIVVTTIANTLGSNVRERISIEVLLGLWFVGISAVGASKLIASGAELATAGLGVLVVLPIVVLFFTFFSKRHRERIRSPFQIFRNGPSSAIVPTLPWLLIPGFLVPCFFFLHLIVLVKMRGQESDSSHTGSLKTA